MGKLKKGAKKLTKGITDPITGLVKGGIEKAKGVVGLDGGGGAKMPEGFSKYQPEARKRRRPGDVRQRRAAPYMGSIVEDSLGGG